MSDTETDIKKTWKGTTGGGDFGQRSLVFLIRVFGLRIMYVIMAFSIPFYVIFKTDERKAIMKYYHDVLGFTPFQSLLRTFKNNYLFGKMMFDRIALMSGTKHKIKINIINEDIFNKLSSEERGFMIASAHIGNFELAGFALHQEKKMIHSVIFGGESAELQKRRESVLSKNNISSIAVSNDMSHIFSIKAALDNGDIVSMPCDRMLGSSKNIPVTLLGKEVHLPMGPFILAAQSNVPMMSIFMMRDKIRQYTAYVNIIDVKDEITSKEKSKKTADIFARQMNEILKKYPDQWFNFYDFWS